MHRDVKPGNILLQDGQAMVADFGIALAVSAAGGPRLTETGLALGTPTYMSPEQATDGRELDARSDVWSLGAVVYEMLVGEPPYVGSSPRAVVAKMLSEPVTPVSRSRELIPANVDAAVRKALARTPADRFDTPAAFAEALADPGFTLPGADGGEEAARRWRWIAGAALGLVIVAVGFAGWAWSRGGTDTAVTRSLLAFPPGEAPVPTWGPSIAVSPDGSTLAYIGPSDSLTAVWVKERDELHGRRLDGTEGAFEVVFAPDGEQLAYLVGEVASGTESLRRVSVEGGPSHTVSERPVFGLVSWGGDGFLYAATGAQLLRIPEDGGEPEELLTASEVGGLMVSVHALPAARGVLFGVTPRLNDFGGAELRLLDHRTGEHRRLLEGVAAAWYGGQGHLLALGSDGTLWGARFDVDEVSLESDLVRLPDRAALTLSNTTISYDEGWFDIDVSRNGALVYLAGGFEGEIDHEAVWVSREGDILPTDPGWRFDLAQNPGLDLSPDGTRLAIGLETEAGEDVWIKHLDRGPLSRLTFQPGEDTRPRWNEEGDSIAYISRRGDSPNYQVWAKAADGTGRARRILALEEGSIFGFSRSEDPDWMALRVGGNSGRDVFAARPGADGTAVPLLTETYDETAVALSPDGTRLAYASRETGRLEVFVRPFPDVGAGKWQVSSGGGTAPVWRRDGRELFYVGEGGEMLAVPVEDGPGFAAGRPEMLFEIGQDVVATDASQGGVHAAYDVDPDGRRFLMIRQVEDAPEVHPLVWVANWWSELEDPEEGQAP